MKINPSGWGLLLFFAILIIQMFTEIPIFPIFIGLVFLFIIGIVVASKLDLSTTPKISDENAEKIMKSLNIDKKSWNRFSRQKKLELDYYLVEQNRIIIKIVFQRFRKLENDIQDKVIQSIKNGEYNKKESELNTKKWYSKREEKMESIRKEVIKEFDNYNLDERLKKINEFVEEFKKEDKRNSVLSEKLESDERRRIERQEKEKKINEEKEKLLKREEEKRKALEIANKRKVEIEEQKILDNIKQKKLIEERKKKEKERYKEYYKHQQREKEKRKKWESEAIEEMINSGEIDGDYTSDRKRNIPSNVKEIVYVRDKGCCITCGSKENIEYDHIIPFSKGGSNSINNIQLLCMKCNRRKSNNIM